MNKRAVLLWASLFVFMVSGSFSAFSEQGGRTPRTPDAALKKLMPPPPPPEHPCKKDAEKFCKDIAPGKGRLRKCLKKHKRELSRECVVKLDEAEENLKKIKKACKYDRKQFCKGVKGQGETVECLRKHEPELSQECRAASQKNI